ncbi:MAG: transglycosylase domain-containing protein, partial [Bacteroidales bacterium]|nr:transglycosylase domain-containing protein [Bacteroidales bacterium]
AADIKKRKFVRGGSTISMQLVKNVFLSRHKTLARKFEEILIVWLIENNRLSSKERMFEVYLNIIEWGPGIYGINEAARFYFDKDPRDLSVNESIFLASIIPSPKRALNSFTDDLQLKPELEGYYRLIAQRLRVKGLITETEEMLIKPEVRLAGGAKRIRESMKNLVLPLSVPAEEE